MDWKKMVDKAIDTVEKRGGAQSVAQDAGELRKIAEGEGSIADKLGRAAAAVKEPGVPS